MKKDEQVHIKEIKMKECRFFTDCHSMCVTGAGLCAVYAVAVGEQVIPASELASAMKQMKELQRLLVKRTMEKIC